MPKPELGMVVKPTTGLWFILVGRVAAASLKPCLQRTYFHICENFCGINKIPDIQVPPFFFWFGFKTIAIETHPSFGWFVCL